MAPTNCFLMVVASSTEAILIDFSRPLAKTRRAHCALLEEKKRFCLDHLQVTLFVLLVHDELLLKNSKSLSSAVFYFAQCVHCV